MHADFSTFMETRMFGGQLNSNAREDAQIRKSAGRALSSANELYAGNTSGAFSLRSLDTSAENIVSGSAAPNAQLALSFDVKVEQLAGGRDIVSDKLDAKASTVAGRGVFSFIANIDNKRTRITVETSGFDSNEDLLGRIADSINNARIGLNAEIERNNFAGTARLRISGIEASGMSSITLRDETGGLLSTVGVSTAREATGQTGGLLEVNGDAVVSLNGLSFRSDSNRIAIYENSLSNPRKMTGSTAEETYDIYYENNGSRPNVIGSSERGASGKFLASLQIKGAGEAYTQIAPDAKNTAQAIDSFVKNTSSLLKSANNMLSTPYSSAKSYIGGTFGMESKALSDAGVEEDNVDEELIQDKIYNRFNPVKQLFGGPAGIAEKVSFGIERIASGLADSISNLPATKPEITAFMRKTGSSLK